MKKNPNYGGGGIGPMQRFRAKTTSWAKNIFNSRYVKWQNKPTKKNNGNNVMSLLSDLVNLIYVSIKWNTMQ